MATEIRPLGNRVLVRVLDEPAVTAGGIIIPDTARDKPQRGEVVALGQTMDDPAGVEPGDIVLYAKYSGTDVTIDGHDHLVLDAADLIASVHES